MRMRCAKHVYKTTRDDQISETQGWEQNLAECPDINHASILVEPLQSGQGSTGVLILAVIVILYNPCAATSSPVQQSKTSRQSHGHAKRILMRRCHITDSSLDTCGFDRRDIEPLLVYRNRNKSRACAEQGSASTSVTWVFNPCSIALIQQDTSYEVEPLLRPCDDDYLIRIAPDATRQLDIVCNRIAKWAITSRVTITGQLSRRMPPAL